MHYVDLEFTKLTNTSLSNVDLTGAMFKYARAVNATFEYSDLMYTDFTYMSRSGVNTFSGTFWYQTIWTNGVRYDSNQAD